MDLQKLRELRAQSSRKTRGSVLIETMNAGGSAWLKEATSASSSTDAISRAKLGEAEDAALREQLAMLMVDVGKPIEASKLLEQLEKRFGADSQRLAVLRGSIYEAKKDFAGASANYERALARHPLNLVAKKRQIALKRSQGDYAGAAQSLNAFLEENQADTEAWAELAELHLIAGAYAKACFCLEEVLLANAYSHAAHTMYGEARYSAAADCEDEQLRRHEEREARSYFAHALNLKPEHNPRAAWGLLVSSAAGCAASGQESAKDKEHVETAKKLKSAASKILLDQIYSGANVPEGMRALVKAVVDQL